MNIHPTQEEVEKRIQEAPEELWEAAMGTGITNAISKLVSELVLSEDKKSGLARVVGLVFLGFIHRAHFRGVLQKELDLSPDTTDKIADGIEQDIFAYISDELDEFYARMSSDVLPTTKPAPTPPSPETTKLTAKNSTIIPIPQQVSQPIVQEVTVPPTEEAVLKPRVQKEEPLAEPLSTPFVLHEHRGAEVVRGIGEYADSLARPSFHIAEGSGVSTRPYAESAPTARLELGEQSPGGSVAQFEPRTTRVGKEEAKIVHYSAPAVQADPFSKAPEPVTHQEEPPSSPKPSVHPDNVVNLKDLPR